MTHPCVALEECCEFLDHIRRPVKESERVNGPYPYFGANGQQGWINDYLFDEPLVLLAEDGGHFSNPERGIAYKIIGKTWVNNHAHVLRPREGIIDVDYLAHALKNKDVRRHLSGSTRDKLTKAGACQIEIPLPTLEEQRRIAAILDKGESIKAMFAKREKAFLSVEESLFAALHEGDNRGLTGRTYSLSDVFWFQEGPGVRNWQFTSSGVKLLNVGNITKDGKVDLLRSERHISEDEAFGRYNHFLVDEGDLLMPSSGIPIEEDGLLRTRSAFARNSDLPLCMNTSTIRFKPKMERASLLFLQGWLQSREFRVQITKLVTGSAQKNFGPSHLKQLSVTLPHSDLQDDFEKRLLRIRKLRHSLNPSESNLAALVFSLGNLAFNGGSLV
jgi:type I restriction enzyme S subunit